MISHIHDYFQFKVLTIFPFTSRYAVYIPLFLPVGIPVVSSIFQLLRWWKNRGKRSQPEELEKTEENLTGDAESTETAEKSKSF